MSVMATPTDRPAPPAVTVGSRTLAFGQRAWVMGVLNVTPDSFSDGGEYFDTQAAVNRAVEMVEAGADIIDIGGESTRPGAEPVDTRNEARRVIPVIEQLRQRSDVWISVDTYKAEVAQQAAAAGAQIINDISGLGFDEEMPRVVAESGCAVVLMHIRGTPETMQRDIDYDDVVEDVAAYFQNRLDDAERAGIPRDRIILDPGIGFGKTVEHNYRLLRRLDRFTELGRPLLVGTSRKSLIGAVTARPVHQRVWGTAATVACSIFSGADIVRVHDVEPIRDVVRVTEAICAMDGPES